MRFWTAILVIFLAISLGACSMRPRRAVVPETFIMDFSLEGLKKRRAFEGIESLRAEVKARISRDGRKVASFKGALAYRPPDTMRLRMFTPFGTTAADLVRVVRRTEIYVPGKDNLYVGWTPAITIPDDAEFRIGLDKGRPVLAVFSRGEVAARYLYDQQTGENLLVETFSGGQRALLVRFGNYAGSVPGLIEFDFGDLQVEMELLDPEVGVELEDRLFHPFDKEDKKVLPLGRIFMKD